jgi:hypothetical protein
MMFSAIGSVLRMPGLLAMFNFEVSFMAKRKVSFGKTLRQCLSEYRQIPPHVHCEIEDAYRRGFHHATVAAVDALDRCTGPDFEAWEENVENWRHGLDTSEAPPKPKAGKK